MKYPLHINYASKYILIEGVKSSIYTPDNAQKKPRTFGWSQLSANQDVNPGTTLFLTLFLDHPCPSLKDTQYVSKTSRLPQNVILESFKACQHPLGLHQPTNSIL